MQKFGYYMGVDMKLWAHRGCSQRYPENTLLAFEKAAAIRNLTGIELDIQLTKDGELVVIHDERVDRTTEGFGFVKDYTLTQIKRLHIWAGDSPSQQIPTIGEVFDLLENRLQSGLKLNIELKNSLCPYDGMEEKIVELVHVRGLEKAVENKRRMRREGAPSFLEGYRPFSRTAAGIHGACMDGRASVSGKTNRHKTESGSA